MKLLNTSTHPTAAGSRVELLDPLRGFAALAVAWYHFTQGNAVAKGWLKETGGYGWLGVEVFFVVSGFVIPYSMYVGGYHANRHLGCFLLKRLIRLEPPYLISIGVVIILWYLSAATPGFRGEGPNIGTAQLLLHVGYLNAFFGYPWLNPVYWTLGIELQYYLLVALTYPLLRSSRPLARAAALVAFCGAAIAVAMPALVFHYLGLFTLGILAFQRLAQMIGWVAYFSGSLVVTGIVWWVQGPEVAAAGLATGLTIVLVRCRSNRAMRGLAFLGTISYSFYLLHVPVGGRVCNLGGRYADGPFAQAAVLIAALCASLLAAITFHRLVEKPFQRLSSGIRYR